MMPVVSSDPLPIYEGDSVEVCVEGKRVSTEVTVMIVGTPFNNNDNDSAVGIGVMKNCSDKTY